MMHESKAPKDAARTELITFGRDSWLGTPHQKASWDIFWKIVLAQVEKKRYSGLQENQDVA